MGATAHSRNIFFFNFFSFFSVLCIKSYYPIVLFFPPYLLSGFFVA